MKKYIKYNSKNGIGQVIYRKCSAFWENVFLIIVIRMYYYVVYYNLCEDEIITLVLVGFACYNQNRKKKRVMEDKDMAETKPKSYRIDEETAERIRQITEEIGEGQQAAFARMIEAYSLQKAKVALVDDRENLEQFENYTSILNRMYIDAVEGKHNMKETVRAEYELLLRSKDETISDLQIKNHTMAELKDENYKRISVLQKENEELLRRIQEQDTKIMEQQEDFRGKLADKDALNQTLNESCSELRNKNSSMESAVREAERVLKEKDELAVSNGELQKRIESMNKEQERSLKEMELEKKHALMEQEEAHKKEVASLEGRLAEAALQGEKELLKLKQQHAEEIEKLKEKMQEKVDSYQNKYMELLERLGSENLQQRE